MKTRNHRELCLGIVAALAALTWCRAQPQVLLHVPFDGTAQPRLAQAAVTARVDGVPSYETGVDGQAILVGGPDRVTLPAEGHVDVRTGSCVFWLKPVDWIASVSTFQFFVSIVHGSLPGTDLLVYKTHNLHALSFLSRAQGVGSRAIHQPILSWQPGVWHHIAITWDKTVRLFVDGQLAGEQPALKMPAAGWARIVVGIPYRHWAYLGERKTAIDDLRIFDQALTAEQITQDHAAYCRRSAVLKQQLEEQKAMQQQAREGNLALATNGAAVLTSSFADYNTSYSDNVIDGDHDTGWRSFSDDLPHWIELRWEYPVRVSRIAFRDVAPSRITTYDVRAWDRKGAWNSLAEVPDAVPDESGWHQCRFAEALTDRLRLVVRTNSGPYTHLTELEAYGPPQPNIGALRPFWRGWHIWYPEPDEKVHLEPRYFRTTFELEAAERVISAYVQLYTNDLYVVTVNGQPAANGFKSMAPVEVSKHLRAGRNVLAVKATPTSQPGWRNMALCAELTVNTETGTRYLFCDESWKTATQAADGWDTPEFDDSQWHEPLRIARVGHAIWGRLPYADRARSETVVIRKVIVPRGPVRPGDSVTVHLHVRPPRPLQEDHVLLYELGEKAVVPGAGDYIVSRHALTPPVPTSQWPTDSDTTIELPLELPLHTPDGDVPVRVLGLSLRGGPGLTFIDAHGTAAADVARLQIQRWDKPTPRPEPRLETETPSRCATDSARTLVIDGQPTVPLIWAYHNPTFEKIHLSAQTGLHLYQARAYPLRPDGTPETIERFTRMLEQHIDCILRIDRDAGILVFLDLRPSSTWLETHPDARLRNAFGKLGPQSYFSAEHRQLVVEHLRDLLERLQRSPGAERIIGYHLITCGTPDSALGGTAENVFEPDRAKITLGDYNPQATAAFRQWLRAKYRNSVPELRTAWKSDTVDFAAADTPDIASLTREGAAEGIFRDPAAGAAPPDYFEFLSGAILRFYLELAAGIKEQTRNRKLVGIYYGYDVHAMTGYNGIGSPLQNNNFDEREMLNTSLIDYYAMVPSYSHRLAGTHFESQHTLASLRLHGKQYMAELDTRTFTADARQWGRQKSVHESVEMLKRDLGHAILNGHAAWFADWSRGGVRDAGFFIDRDLLQTIAQAHGIYARTLHTPRAATAEIAVVVSGKAWFYHDIYTTPPLYHNLVRRMLSGELPHIGAPYDVIRLEDLCAGLTPERYKLFIFINPFVLDAAERRAISALKSNGRTLLWFYAPGYVTPGAGLDLQGIREMTGIGVGQKPEKEQMECRITNREHRITRGLAPDHRVATTGFGYARSNALHPPAFGPVFYVDDDRAHVLGTYPDERPALAVRESERWTSIYCAVPFADKALLRNIAEFAGVHLYCEPGPMVCANNRFLLVHKGFGEPESITIHLPQPRTVTDLFTGMTLAEQAQTFALPAKSCRTFLLGLDQE